MFHYFLPPCTHIATASAVIIPPSIGCCKNNNLPQPPTYAVPIYCSRSHALLQLHSWTSRVIEVLPSTEHLAGCRCVFLVFPRPQVCFLISLLYSVSLLDRSSLLESSGLAKRQGWNSSGQAFETGGWLATQIRPQGPIYALLASITAGDARGTVIPEIRAWSPHTLPSFEGLFHFVDWLSI